MIFLKYITSLVKEAGRVIATVLVLGGLVAVAFAYSEPGAAPTGGTVYAPVNTSANAQTKTGALTVGGLTSNGNVTASSWTVTGNILNALTQISSPRYCIGASCITSWPAGGGATPNLQQVTTTGDTTNTNIVVGYSAGSSGGVFITRQGQYGQPSVQGITTGFAPGTLAINPVGGNVGIGTAGPGAKLHIEASSASEALRINTGGPGAELIVRYGGSNEIVSIGSWSVGGLNFYSTCCGYTNPADGSIVLFPRTGQLRTKGDAWFATVSGNVGIGTTAPGQKLDVVGGYIRSNTGFCINASCITAWPGGGGLTGAGTTNYISKWTGGTSLGNSILFDNGSRVGIGTAAPLDPLGWASSLDVAGGMTASRYHDRQNTAYFVDLDAGANLGRDWLFGGNTVIEPSWDINMGLYSNKKIITGSTMQASDVWLAAPNFGSPRWASAPATGGSTGLGIVEARSGNTYYTAATDGFVTVSILQSGDAGCIARIESPNGVDRVWSRPNRDSPQVAMMYPVRKGVVWGVIHGCPSLYIWWIPLGN